MAHLNIAPSELIRMNEATTTAPKTVESALLTLNDSYDRLILVSQSEQLDGIQPDEATLVIVCDWLLWQQISSIYPHSIFYEAGMKFRTADDDLGETLFLKANDWVYAVGEEKMRFMGVVLGKMYASEMTRANINYYRIFRTLVPLIENFNVREIIYFDYRNEINFFDYAFRKNLIRTLAEERNLSFIDKSNEDDDNKHTVGPQSSTKQTDSLRSFLRHTYGFTLQTLSRLSSNLQKPKPRVAVLVNSNLLKPLLDGFDRHNVTPIINLLSVPKSFSAIWKSLRNGTILFYSRETSLNITDLDKIQVIEDSIQSFEMPKNLAPAIQFSIDYFKKQILEKGRLVEAGRAVKSAQIFFHQYKPKRIVVDGVKNMLPRSYIEAARLSGAEVDYLWHAPLTPQHLKFDLIGGDTRTTPLVTRILSWGKINEKWLDDIHAQQPVIRVGSPLAGKYKTENKNKPHGNKRALILQYAPIGSDLEGLNENMYLYFFEVAKTLKQLGYTEMRLKLHPGPGRWPKTYFADIASYFGIDCDILKTEPLEESLKWADIVVGPVQSGAFFEALAAGKKYIAFLIPPHTMNETIYANYPVLSSFEQLGSAISNDTDNASKTLLDGLYGIDEIANPPKVFWQAQEAS